MRGDSCGGLMGTGCSAGSGGIPWSPRFPPGAILIRQTLAGLPISFRLLEEAEVR
jgi:hypothetical protein